MGIIIMGSGASTSTANDGELPIPARVQQLLPPYYVKDASVTERDVELAKAAWKHITENTSPKYLHLKETDPTFESASCLSWFYDAFFHHSDGEDDASRFLYKNMKVQVKALVGMIGMTFVIFKPVPVLIEEDAPSVKITNSSSILGGIGNSVREVTIRNSAKSNVASEKNTTMTTIEGVGSVPPGCLGKLQSSLAYLATTHSTMGIRSHQYPLVGTILFMTFEQCLGDEAWDTDTRLAWEKMFSVMLTILLPLSVAEDRKTGAAANDVMEADRSSSRNTSGGSTTGNTTTSGKSQSSSLSSGRPLTLTEEASVASSAAAAVSESTTTLPPTTGTTNDTTDGILPTTVQESSLLEPVGNGAIIIT